MARRMILHSKRIARGFSLIEMVAAAVIFSILMLALQSTVMLSAKAMPDNGGSAARLTVESGVLNRIAHDLHYASSVTLGDNRTLRMVVADQDGDGIDETITYQWDGTTGSDLTRTRNGGAASLVASAVRDFSCAMRKKAVSTSTTTYGSADSAEQALAGFNDYGISGTANPTYTLTNDKYAAEYFRFNAAAVPANATSINITRIGVWMQGINALGGTVMEIRRAVGNGAFNPSMIRVGSPSSISGALLTASLGWNYFPFSDVVISNPQEELAFVLYTSNSSLSSLLYRNNSNGPADSPKMFWSNDGGISWSPSASNVNEQDLIFTVYGTVTAPTVATTATTRYYLTGLDLRLCLGTRDGDAQILSVSTPNQPEVAGP